MDKIIIASLLSETAFLRLWKKEKNMQSPAMHNIEEL